MPVRNILQKLPINKQRLHSELGFTLLETVIVLVCLSALLAVALPGYNRMIQEHELRNAANQLFADLRECRSLAVAESQQYKLLLLNERGYSIQGSSLNKQVSLPSGITFQLVKMGLQSDAVTFNDKGHPTVGGSIIMQNRSGKAIKLIVYLHSGQIEMSEAKDE